VKRAVFFDRDGTLVRAFPEGDTTRGPRTVDEIEILPGTIECIRALQDDGWYCVSMATTSASTITQIGVPAGSRARACCTWPRTITASACQDHGW
jgi:histidinol phosphatase-like enzyme